jgi:dsDNA-specific endonuclease/ATPase MutS2
MPWSEIREVLSQLRTVRSIEPISIETHDRAADRASPKGATPEFRQRNARASVSEMLTEMIERHRDELEAQATCGAISRRPTPRLANTRTSTACSRGGFRTPVDTEGSLRAA